jgi:diguanylate cyclase (GGDEF)-like protein
VTALDPRTIAFAALVGAATLAAMLTLYWTSRRTHPGFGWWISSLWCISVALTLITLRGPTGAGLYDLLTNLLSLTALACIVLGVHRFNDRPSFDPVLIALLVLGIGGVLVAYLDADLAMRSARGAGAMGMIAAWAAWCVWRETPARLRVAALTCAVVLASVAAWRFWRAWFFLTAPVDYDILDQQFASVLNFTLNVLVAPTWGFAFFLLNAARTEAELEDAREAARALAEHDALTGLGNRRSFFLRGAEQVTRARRYGNGLSLLIVDVDRFKMVNDTHGHPAGDAVLRTVAEVLANQVRDVDHVARIGGEEFAVWLPETGSEAAAALAERLRVGVRQRTARELPVTVSIGVATLAVEGDLDAVYRAADHALYQAKAAGRDRIAVG